MRICIGKFSSTRRRHPNLHTKIVRRNRNESSWKPTKNTKICSLHFEDKVKYITKGGLCKIRKNAVPTKTNKNVNLSASITPLSSDSSDLDSIFDSPKEASLRRQLRKMMSLQEKHSREIKSLKQKNRRLKKRNATLKNILVDLRKKFVSNPK
ncbi:hypothetical protein ABMA27_001167 [Loxostege sticticalis]|uniref:THAP-type domain-containing protein n=1 Tax=Loxostege sticticalis TaxID=481309 RepID=A0ABR3HXS3_LOXSC